MMIPVMGTIRLLGIPLLIVAFAANPVLARMLPCGCNQSPADAPACCLPGSADSSTSSTCCGAGTDSNARLSETENSGVSGTCCQDPTVDLCLCQAGLCACDSGPTCCVEPASIAVTAGQGETAQLLEQLVLEQLSHLAIAGLAPPSAVDSGSLFVGWAPVDLSVPDRPSRMILYCSWLN